MLKLRLFIAIPLPDNLLDNIIKCQNSLKTEKALSNSGARFTSRENLHITVLFLGYLEEKSVDQLLEIIRQTTNRVSPFSLTPVNFTFASPCAPPRMVWLNFQKNDEYNWLYRNLSRPVKDFFNKSQQKFDYEKREKLIHVTAARFKSPPVKNETDKIKLPAISHEEFLCREIILYKSILKKEGAQYVQISRFNLT